MFQLRTNLWRTRPAHTQQRRKQKPFPHLLWPHLPPPPWVLCTSLFLSILCRVLQIHSHWCWSVIRDNNLVSLCKLVCWLSQLSRTWFGKTAMKVIILKFLFEILVYFSAVLGCFHLNFKPFNLTIISFCPISTWPPTQTLLRESCDGEKIRLPKKRLRGGRLISATVKILPICT